MGTLAKHGKVPLDLSRLVAKVSKEDPGFGGRINRRLTDALSDWDALVEEGGDDPGEADAALASELGDLLFDLYSHRECFLRQAEILRAEAARHTDWVVENAERMLLAFVRGQMDMAREEIRSDHRWYTGLKDTGAAAWQWFRWLDKAIDEKLDGKKPSEPKPQFEGFFQKVVSRHLNKQLTTNFMLELEKDLTADLRKRWDESIRSISDDVEKTMADLRVRSSFAAASAQSMGLDDGSKTALVGLGAAAASTVVLAAGWHTLAWSMGGLFLPLLPVVAVATVAVAVFRGKSEFDKVLGYLDAYQANLEKLLSENVKYRMRAEIMEQNTETARRLKDLFFRHQVGRFSADDLDGLIRGLETWLDDLGRPGADDRPASKKAAGVDWTARARESLSAGAELPAAMYGALAFEQLLRGINRKQRLGFDFRVAHHNRAFIDVLEQCRTLPPDGISRLRDLKRQRDTFTHRMHFFATVSESRRRKSVARFLSDLEAAGRS